MHAKAVKEQCIFACNHGSCTK